MWHDANLLAVSVELSPVAPGAEVSTSQIDRHWHWQRETILEICH